MLDHPGRPPHRFADAGNVPSGPLRFLVDIAHPAHVHFFRHLIGELGSAGHSTRVVARDKDVTRDLLDAYGIPYSTTGRAAGGGRVALARELLRRDRALLRAIKAFRPHAVLTRNPSGVQAAWLARVVGVFDTDDGDAVGIHFRAAAPFAHVITTPDCLDRHYGARHVTYPSYKPLAFLHPNRFTPDPSVRAALGVGDGRYTIVRFVALAASHDRGATGLDADARRDVVQRLARRGPVFITSEAALPPELAPFAFPLSPHRLHDALAFASVCVTDGQSMASEAAVLGVPCVRLASSSGQLAVLRELEHRYGLVFEFSPGDERAFVTTVERIADDSGRGGDWQQRRARLLADKCDLTSWMLELCRSLPNRVRARAWRRSAGTTVTP